MFTKYLQEQPPNKNRTLKLNHLKKKITKKEE